ncbi:MAG: small multi-drug export protein [Eubacteriales bacterium]|nr:small multi-drug export protein [Baileyella intestinalis]MCI7686506.1 small multi-drug export protein [Clostridiales bacterium]MDD5875037.1 small multi-drug export protein [Baileyella intestinalis]MDY2995383.1 small multi-drug export protein [Baileyella intestinalis]
MKSVLMTILVSMLPVIELRGGIPYGVVAGLGVKTALTCALIGNILPVPFLILFTTKVFAWLRTKSPKLDRLVVKMEQKGMSKKDVIDKYEFWGLVLLVAIPLPGTGAWTGCLVAALLEMDVKKSIPAVILGVLIAGAIVSFITYGAELLV